MQFTLNEVIVFDSHFLQTLDISMVCLIPVVLVAAASLKEFQSIALDFDCRSLCVKSLDEVTLSGDFFIVSHQISSSISLSLCHNELVD